jgi:hypothetical protein
MKITPEVLKEYALGELSAADRRHVESAAATDPMVREELSRLQWTHSALQALPELEMPRRIAFVSDRVFEPKWWQVWLQSGPRMAFASACLLALAILGHAVLRAPATVAPPERASAERAILERQIGRRVTEEVARALPAALAQAEDRHRTELARAVAQAEERYRKLRQEDLQIMEANYNLWREKEARRRVDMALFQTGGEQ